MTGEKHINNNLADTYFEMIGMYIISVQLHSCTASLNCDYITYCSAAIASSIGLRHATCNTNVGNNDEAIQ